MPIVLHLHPANLRRRLRAYRLLPLLIVLLAAALNLPAAHAASTWYVAPTGSDASDCLTAATACKTVTGAIAKSSNADTIIIAAGIYLEQLIISKSLTLIGAGSTTTIIDGDRAGRVVTIDATTAVVSLNALTVRNGNVGILSGGGIYNGGTLTVTDSTIRDNSAGSGGGGIRNNGDLTLVNSNVISNTVSPNGGGGILNDDGKRLRMVGSTISNNRADSAGGIINGVASYLSILNSTISDNISSRSLTSGGGILNFKGTVVLTNTSIIANGGGVFNIAPATIIARNSIIAQNIPSGDCNTALSSAGYNLDSDGTCGLGAMGDRQMTDPKVGPLENNGGSTWTRALLTGSPAIDAGDPSNCPATDQRGVRRPQGSACDIGAYERASEIQKFLPLIQR